MVKIQDPRADRSAIAMRNLRAMNAYKYIKKSKSKKFNEDKLKLEKTDIDFYEEFKNSSIDIKQELIFLWEEVGNLLDYIEENEIKENQGKTETETETEIDKLQNQKRGEEEEDNVKLLINEKLHNVEIPESNTEGPPILTRNYSLIPIRNYAETTNRKYIFGP